MSEELSQSEAFKLIDAQIPTFARLAHEQGVPRAMTLAEAYRDAVVLLAATGAALCKRSWNRDADDYESLILESAARAARMVFDEPGTSRADLSQEQYDEALELTVSACKWAATAQFSRRRLDAAWTYAEAMRKAQGKSVGRAWPPTSSQPL